MDRKVARNFHGAAHHPRFPFWQPLHVWILAATVAGASTFSPSFPCRQQRQSKYPSIGLDVRATADEAPLSKTTRSAVVVSSHVPSQLGAPVCEYHVVTVPTSQSGPPRQDVSVEDVTPCIRDLVHRAKMRHGTATIMSRHTTTSIVVNERECRLAQDVAATLLQLLPPDERSGSPHAKPGIRYRHNDLNERPESPEERQRCLDNGWDVDDPAILQAWRDQEPINAHSHLLSMMLGSSECLPVVDGRLAIGQWQSILLVDLDGPRERTVGVQLMGYQ